MYTIDDISINCLPHTPRTCGEVILLPITSSGLRRHLPSPHPRPRPNQTIYPRPNLVVMYTLRCTVHYSLHNIPNSTADRVEPHPVPVYLFVSILFSTNTPYPPTYRYLKPPVYHVEYSTFIHSYTVMSICMHVYRVSFPFYKDVQ